MLGHKEDSDIDRLDLRSMLHNIGLVRSNHQDALLEIHEKISDDNSTTDKLNLVHLLHSAFLITQQLSRGFSASEAFDTCCVDVYLKSRYVQQQALTRERLGAVIKDCIERHCVTEDRERFFDLGSATWRVDDLQDNSKLTIVRQQGFLLDSAIRMYKSFVKNKLENSQENAYLTSEYLNEFLAPSSASEAMNIEEILPYLLLRFYEDSSMGDAKLRSLWLSEILSGESSLKQLGERSGSLSLEIAASNDTFNVEALPWDPASLPNIANGDSTPGRANRLALILYLLTANIQYGGILDDRNFNKNEKIITVSQYSNAVYHGEFRSIKQSAS